MSIARWARKMANKIVPTEENKTLSKWKERLEIAKSAYQSTLSDALRYQEYYDGTRKVNGNPNSQKSTTKLATNTRNIVYELIESQVDSSIPQPKITPLHEEDAELARQIEHMLINETKTLRLQILNDKQERITPVMGGDFMHIEWDQTKGLHSTLGDISISERNPSQVLPQPGMTDIDSMDYIFIRMSQTKDYVKKRYGVDVKDAEEEAPELRKDSDDNNDFSKDIVTVNIAYYRNGKGGIGCYSWCDDYVLEDMEDYQARQREVCSKCGTPWQDDWDSCPKCGSKKHEKAPQDYEELLDTLTIKATDTTVEPDSEIQEPQEDENGNPVVDESGNPVIETKREKKKVPYYKPNCFPIVERINVTSDREFLGCSDVKVIMDQQDQINKLSSKINEKLLKGGSFVTLPKGIDVQKNSEELNIIRLENAAQKALIDVLNMQPDISKDITMLNLQYEAARSTIGITDAYQGKYDASATSGTAKQYSINQAAGRLESKRIMKNIAYSKLYELMFKYILAYADQPIPVTYKDDTGEEKHEEFDRYQFLRVDSAGEFYWDDEFIFETDPTSTMMSNREAMWNAIDVKYQAGAFGAIGQDATLLLYWQLLEKCGYPNAGSMKKAIEERIQRTKDMQEQNAQNQALTQSQGQSDTLNQLIGGANNAMSGM